MREKRAIVVLMLIFLAAIASFVGVVGYLSINWPLYFFPALIVLVAFSLVLDYRARRRILILLDTNGYISIAESEPNTYTGIYRPHWEIGHIQIPLAQRSVLGFPTFESWCPKFADDVTELEAEEGDLLNGSRQFIITFVGTPSKRGQFHIS